MYHHRLTISRYPRKIITRIKNLKLRAKVILRFQLFLWFLFFSARIVIIIYIFFYVVSFLMWMKRSKIYYFCCFNVLSDRNENEKYSFVYFQFFLNKMSKVSICTLAVSSKMGKWNTIRAKRTKIMHFYINKCGRYQLQGWIRRETFVINVILFTFHN